MTKKRFKWPYFAPYLDKGCIVKIIVPKKRQDEDNRTDNSTERD